MLRRFGDIIFKHSSAPNLLFATVPAEDLHLVNMFSQNLDVFNTIRSDNESAELLSRILTQFELTFQNIRPEHLGNPEIRGTLEKYTQYCAENAAIIMNDMTAVDLLFASLNRTAKLYAGIPNPKSFVPFFIMLCQKAKSNQLVLEKGKVFLTTLFKNSDFFFELVIRDGFELIFTTFFIQYEFINAQILFIYLLFSVVPMDFYRVSIETSTIKLFIDTLKSQSHDKGSYRNSCLFLVHFVSIFAQNDQTLYQQFDEMEGFALLNSLFLNNCPKSAHECYEILMIESGIDPTVIKNAYVLFDDPKASGELRSEIISVLNVRTKNESETFNRLSVVGPITLWLRRPPQLLKTGLEKLAALYQTFINWNLISVKDILAPILPIISPPNDDEIPFDSFFSIIENSLVKKEITPIYLIQQKFLEYFVFQPDDKIIAEFYTKNQGILGIITLIYQSDEAEEYRFPMLQKFINSSKNVEGLHNFIVFISNLFESHFTFKDLKLLLSFISLHHILLILTKEVKKRIEAFQYFMEAGGFTHLTEHLVIDPESAPYIMKLISALAQFSPHHEIDEWILNQPIDSPLFGGDQNMLAQMAVGFSSNQLLHIPSLLPFCINFNPKSPLNLFIAGKYGVKACNARKVELLEIPQISLIANRYIEPSTAHALFMSDPLHVCKYIDLSMPQFSLFEYIPKYQPAYIMINQPFQSMSFWFKIPETAEGEFPLMTSGFVSVAIAGESLIFSTKNQKVALLAAKDNWHHVIIHLHQKRNTINKVEILLDKTKYSLNSTDTPTTNNTIIFGNDKAPIPVPLYLSKAIIISETLLTDAQVANIQKKGPGEVSGKCEIKKKSSAVYDVHYLGFASYFRSSIQIERLFYLLEFVKHKESFESVYHALINLQQLHHLKLKKFWARMILAFKRQHKIISPKFDYFSFTLLSKLYTGNKLSKIQYFLLSDIEIYSLIPANSIREWIKKICLSHLTKWNILDKFNLIETLFTIIRSGIPKENIILSLPLFSKLCPVQPTPSKLKSFFNSSMSLCNWTFNNQQEEEDQPVQLQITLFRVFVQSAQINFENELYNYHELLNFMLMYNDERSLVIGELIVYYSQQNARFVVPSTLACHIFSNFAHTEKAWLIAFSIISGSSLYTEVPNRFQIKRPSFTITLMDMLSTLCSLVAKHSLDQEPTESNLLFLVVSSLLSLEKNQYCFFSQTHCIAYLHKLSILGVIPSSYNTKLNTREEFQWPELQSHVPSKDDLKVLSSLITPSVYFQPNIPEIPASKTLTPNIPYFPFDSDECSWLTNIISSTQLIEFFTNILFSASAPSFHSLLTDFTVGNAFMYSQYRIFFAQTLIRSVLISLISLPADSIQTYQKPAFLVTAKLVLQGLFNDTLMEFYTLLYRFLQSVLQCGNFDSFLSDPQIVKGYREIILIPFIYIENFKLIYQLYIENEKIIFHKSLFSDNTFSLMLIHITRQKNDSSPECVRFITSMMQLCNNSLVSSYNPIDSESFWSKFKNQVYGATCDDAFIADQEARIKQLNTIIEPIQHKQSLAYKYQLMGMIYRSLNITNEMNLVIHSLNLKMRSLEKSFYEFSLLSTKDSLHREVATESYHESPLAFPMYQARAITPSPFPIKSPSFSTKTKTEFFALSYTPKESRIAFVEQKGTLKCAPQWHYFHNEGKEFTSPFEYSKLINQGPMMLCQQFLLTFNQLGPFNRMYNVSFFYFIHSIPSVLFMSDTTILILVLAQSSAKGLIELIPEPQSPVAFLPFTEAVTLGEFSTTSLFCGHIVLQIHFDKIIKMKYHLYIHQPIGLSISSFAASEIIIVFKNKQDLVAADKFMQTRTKLMFKAMPQSQFLFCIPSLQAATNLWTNNIISNFAYLLVLNSYGGRSKTDLCQYPVFPWVTSPNLDYRPLSKPMGQLSAQRAEHYEQTYELSDPKYFYGFHYSLPGVIFWLLMRLPPFTYFQWDLNKGWDDSQRLFVSISDAYLSASSANPSDLKELVPQMYTVPEALVNINHLKFADEISENVQLPDWSKNNSSFFTETSMKMLNGTQQLNEWIDLIFGYKQAGEAAIEAKNVFLHSSYHTCTNEDVQMDDAAFESQVLNFGQCPIQLFTKGPHPTRLKKKLVPIDDLPSRMFIQQPTELINPTNIDHFKGVSFIDRTAYAIPFNAAIVPFRFRESGSYFDFDKDCEKIVLVEIPSMKIIFAKSSVDFAFISSISVSHDGLFLSLTFEFGRVDIYQISYATHIPSDLIKFTSFYVRSAGYMSSILSSDYICASVFKNEIVLWNTATQMRHRDIKIEAIPLNAFFDHFNAVLTLIYENQIDQYTLNGQSLRTLNTTDEITCAAIFPYDFSLDGRLLVTGTKTGIIVFYAVDPVDYKLKKICTKQIHKYEISSLLVDRTSLRIVTTDVRGIVFITDVDILDKNAEILKCSICGSPQVLKCIQCQAGLCECCKVPGNDFCPNCQQGMEFNFAFAHF